MGGSSGVAEAGDGWFGPAPRGAGGPPVRTFLGVPLPQQWTGQAPRTGRSAPAGVPAGANAVCRNGRCPTPASGAARSSVGAAGGVGNRCPGGVCPVPQVTRRAPATMDNATGGRSLRAEPADPFRPASRSRIEPDSWFTRPVTAPLRDAFGSGYSNRELDLRRDYFRGNAEQGTRRERVPASGRSMEVPVERPNDTARI